MNLLESMRYLAALEQHRHFGRAAQASHITQPALSNAIRALEEELGVALVRRSRQYEGLTLEGELVLAHAHRLLHGAEALRQELASLAGTPRGALHIGAIPTAIPVAARFAARLRGQHPGIRPVLHSLSSQALETGLETLSLDLALGYAERLPEGGRRFDLLPQYEESYFLIRRQLPGGPQAAGASSAGLSSGPQSAASSGLHFGPPWGWARAAEQPLVMLTPEMHNRVVVERALAAAGVPASPAMETDSVLALLQAVLDDAAGELAAVLPGALVSTVRHQPGWVVHPLEAPVVRTPISWITAAATPPTRVLAAALTLARDEAWLAHLARHSGSLSAAE
ncbi:MAG: hypothetical protein RL722_2019 [Pseudomonadota bacterium]|jgi:DNA-binding transcriptional LysR family regulator